MKFKKYLIQVIRQFAVSVFLLVFFSCQNHENTEINVGYIGPFSTRATELGIGPANAMKLAINKYNKNKLAEEPKINLYIEDDKWLKENALPAYRKLKDKHDIDVLFISNTDGTIAIQDEILKDKVIVINPLNNDASLSKTNENTFKIAKTTEEANGIIGERIIELGLKKVQIIQYPNIFMRIATKAVEDLLEQANIDYHVITTEVGVKDFKSLLEECQKENFDAYIFFGYKEFGFAMKQARDIGITAPFFGSTVLLDPAFYENSEGAIIGTECSFFTPTDGNYILANKFLNSYRDYFNEEPNSVWPPMQAYDAMNLVINELRTITESNTENLEFEDWLRLRIKNVQYYQGICGNISISENGSSKGIYFSLYTYESKGKLLKVKR